MKWDVVFEWTATALLILCVILTSFNVYPANIFVGVLSNGTWILVSWLWRKWSLCLVSVVVTGIYLSGIANYWMAT